MYVLRIYSMCVQFILNTFNYSLVLNLHLKKKKKKKKETGKRLKTL